MNTAHQRGAALALLLCLAVSCAAAAVPTFTDQDVEAGHLNPADTEIVVQTIRVAGDSTHATDFNAVQIRNGGTATYQQITRIEVRNGGTTICAMDTPIGLTSQSGVTIPTTHSLPKGDTEDISILVWIGDTSVVQGGETVQFEVRFHYTLDGAAGTSQWIADGEGEDVTKTGFENIDDSSPAANNFNPGDQSTVQRVSFRDEDANTSDQTVTTVVIQNTGTATADDLASLKVAITHAGGTWQETKTTGLGAWKNGGIVFDPPDILIADEGQLTVEVDVQVADPTPTVPVDSHTMRTRTTLSAVENGQEFAQEAVSSTTQQIRKGGIEEIEEDSTVPPSGVLNPNETLTQKIIARDRDVNGDLVNVTRLWVRNLGTAAETEVQWIRVKSGGATLGTFTGAQITPFLTGVWLNITDVLVADEGDRTFLVEYKIASSQTLKPQVKLECNEDGDVYNTATADYPEAITLYGAGLEILENQALDTATVYSLLRFCAQKILLRDIDENTDSVTINPVVVRNRGTAADTEIAKIEVRTTAGALLGETSTVGGLSSGGIAVPTLQNNVVPDNGEVTLWVWVTLADPEKTVAGHTLQLETTVFHTEDGVSYEQTVQGTSFTSAINHRPVPDFTFAKAIAAAASIGPKADFTYEDTIQFSGTATDQDGDAIATWQWNFGDGNTSNVQNPTHEYPDGGTFTVTLTVTDARGVTGSVSKTIEVEGPPNVAPVIDAINTDPESPATDEDVDFSADITDPDQPAGTAFTYAWDFGDGTTSVLAAPTHPFTNKQTYTVTLTVTDAQGATATATKAISVGNEKPVASFTPSTTTPSTGDAVQFTDTSTDPGDDPADTPFTYAWDFDDGVTSTAQNPTHTYTTPDTYTVTLIVTDSRGGVSDPTTADITVAGPARTVLFAFPNPAATVATFTYFLVEGATDPILRIYNVIGKLVVEQALPAGGTTFGWDLRTAGGAALPNGLYFCVVTVTGANPSEIFRLLIVR